MIFRHRPTLYLAIEVINGFASGPKDGHADTGTWHTDPGRHVILRTNAMLDALGLTNWPREAIPFVMKPYGVNARNPRPRMAPYMRGPDSLTDEQRRSWWTAMGWSRDDRCIVYNGSRPSGDNGDDAKSLTAIEIDGAVRIVRNACLGPKQSVNWLTILDNCQPADPVCRPRTRNLARNGYRIGGEAFPRDPEWLKWCSYFSRHCNLTARGIIGGDPKAYPIPRKAELLVGFDGVRHRMLNGWTDGDVTPDDEVRRPVTADEVHAVIKRLWNAKSITLVVNSPLDAPGVYEAWKQHKENGL